MKKIILLFSLLVTCWQINAQYCTPSVLATGCTAGDEIDSFTIPNAGFSHLNTGCSGNNYGDFTSDPTLEIDLPQSTPFDFEITHNFGTQFVKIWIDFNANQTFEDTEIIFTSTQGSNPTLGTFTIPNTVPLGTTRMRVVDIFGQEPSDPCTPTGTWGETHDYTVNILAPPTCPIPTNLALTSVQSLSADFSWDAVPEATVGYNWEVFNQGDDPDTATPVSTGTFASGVTSGQATGLTELTDYDFYLTADCGANGLSTTNGPISFTTTPLCPIPTNLAVSNLLSNSADLSWDEEPNASNGYQWFVFNSGDDPATATPVSNGTTAFGTLTATASGLTADTVYEAYISADCDTDGTSELSAAVAFTTPCTALIAPITENFDGSTWVAGTGFGNTGSDIDNCWSRTPDGTGFFWGTRSGATGSTGTGPSAANSTPNYIFTEGSNGLQGDEAMLVSPLIDLSSLNTPALTFWYHMFGPNMGTLSVDVDAGSGFDLDVFTISGQQQAAGSDAFIEQIVDLSAYTGQSVRIRFRGVKGGGFESDIAIDDFKVDEAPSCLKPDNLALVDVFFDSAEVSWDAISNATNGYIWEVYNAGDDPATATPVSTGTFAAGTTQGIADGLSPETDYDLYLIADCGTDGLSELTNPVSFTTTELCSLPSTFDVINLLPDSVELTWSSIPNATNGYVWAVFNAGDDPATATPVASGNASSIDNSVVVTGLTQNTNYEAYITTDCGTDGLSDQSPALSFTTPCNVFVAPITEDFDSANWVAGTGFGNTGDAIDGCWSRTPDGSDYFWGTRSGTTNSTGTGPDGANSSPNYIYTEGSNGLTGDEAMFESPLIDLSSLTEPALTFWYHMFGADIGTLSVDVNPGPGYDLDVFTISGEQQTAESDTFIEQIVDLSAYAGQTVTIRFRAVKGGGFASDIAIDDFKVDEAPSCLIPTGLSVSNITETTADLSWSPVGGATSGYNWFIFNVGDDPAVDTPVASGSVAAGVTTANITGLPSSSTLEAYIQSNCGSVDGLSDLSPAVEFDTLCDVFPTPYFEDFANFEVTTSFVEDGCWTETSVDTFTWDVGTGQTTSTGTGPDGAQFGSNYIFTEASSGSQGDEAIVITPDVDLANLTEPSLSFWYHMFGADMGTLHIDIDDGTNLDLSVVTITGQQQSSESDVWLEQFVDLNAYAGQTIQVRFRVERGDGFTSDVAIDGVRFDEAPSCFTPTNLAVSNITENTADFSWDGEATATTGYDWFVFNAGDDPLVDTPVASGSVPSGTTTANATGLPSSSFLEFYVQSDCGTDGVSLLSQPLSFETLCDAFPTPYFEDFGNFTVSTNFVEDGCWTETSTDTFAWDVGTGQTGSIGTGPNDALFGSNYLFTEASSGSQGDEATVLTPLVDLTNLTEPALSFWFHMFGADMGTLHIDIDDGTNVDLSVLTISGQQQTSETDNWQEEFVDLTPYSGQTIQVIFRVERGDGFTSDVAIDGVRFDEAPSCFKPSNVNIVDVFFDSVEVSWNPVTNAVNGYLWEVYNAGDDPAVDAPVSSGTFAAGTSQGIADGLTPEMDYDLYLIADCGSVDGQSVLSIPVSFTTTELCSLPSTFDVVNILPDSAELVWTSIPNAVNGYNWAVFNAGDDPATATPVASGSAASGDTMAVATGLTDNTEYEAYITTDCGTDGTSDQSQPLAFMTPCNIFTAPYFNDFEALTPTTNLDNDDCWTEVSTDIFSWDVSNDDTPSNNTGPNQAFSGTNFVFSEASSGSQGDEALLESPLVDLSPLSTPSIAFWYHMFGGDMGTLHVDVNDGSGYVLDVFTIVGQQQANQSDDWIQQIIDLSAFSGQTVKVRLRAERGGGFESDIAVDDFRIEEAPTCFDPFNLSVLSVTDTSADLTWDAGSSETIFDVEVVVSGTTPTGVPTFEDVSVPFTATGLTSETTYDFYVRADCGAGDVSNWMGPESFTTAITPVTVTVNGPSVNNTYCYDNSEFKEWLFISSDFGDPSVTPVEVIFNGGTIEDGPGSTDRFRVFNGFDETAPVLYDSDVDGTDLAGVTLAADSGAMYMLLESDIFGSCQSGVDIEVPLDFDVFAGVMSTVAFSNNNFKYYPNPVSSTLSIDSANLIESVKVFNVLGKEVFSNTYDNTSVDINMNALSSGTYLMKVTIGGNTQTFKVIKE